MKRQVGQVLDLVSLAGLVTKTHINPLGAPEVHLTHEHAVQRVVDACDDLVGVDVEHTGHGPMRRNQ